MFDTGFLGTRALLFMDIVTLWFAALPFLMAAAIYMARCKRFIAHRRMQTVLFALTLVMVVIFEVGVRFSGGFLAYAEHSSVSFSALVALLAVHIVIAVAAVGMWAWLLIDSLWRFGNGGGVIAGHKRYGITVFSGMTVTSFLGVLIYMLLFVI
jgi:putative membrane protein